MSHESLSVPASLLRPCHVTHPAEEWVDKSTPGYISDYELHRGELNICSVFLVAQSAGISDLRPPPCARHLSSPDLAPVKVTRAGHEMLLARLAPPGSPPILAVNAAINVSPYHHLYIDRMAAHSLGSNGH